MVVVLEKTELPDKVYYSIVGVRDCEESDPVYCQVGLLIQEYNVVAGDIAISNKEQSGRLQKFIKELEALGVEIEYRETLGQALEV